MITLRRVLVLSPRLPNLSLSHISGRRNKGPWALINLFPSEKKKIPKGEEKDLSMELSGQSTIGKENYQEKRKGHKKHPNRPRVKVFLMPRI